MMASHTSGSNSAGGGERTPDLAGQFESDFNSDTDAADGFAEESGLSADGGELRNRILAFAKAAARFSIRHY
jgi:hypothetical protein